MRLPSSILSQIFLFSTSAPLVSAIPPVMGALLGVLDRRDCASLCGVDKFLCCPSASVCATTYSNAAPYAICTAAGAAAANYQVITTVITETDYRVRTTTMTLGVQAATTQPYLAASTAICSTAGQTISCGSVCCKDATEYCYTGGWCKPWAGNSDSYLSSYTATVTGPSRPTTVTTSTVAITTTQGFQSTIGTSTSTTIPISAASTSTGLSGGAIAGIVVGVIVGIILLLTLCFCCLFKAAFDTILAIFGLGKGRKKGSSREEVIEERRYSRYGGSAGGASRRSEHRGWFGGAGGGRKTTVVSEKRKSSGAKEGGMLAGLALGLAGLWAVLGLRRREKEKKRAHGSEVSYSSYTDSYTGTSASSASSDRRTRQSSHRPR